MSWRYDPELDEVFTDAGERRMAAILSSVQAPQVEPDPAFRSQLRRHLMAQAWARAEPRLPWWRRLSAPAPAAWGMATVGAILIAAAVYLSVHPGTGGQTILVSYNVDSTQPVAAVRPLDVTFSQPMDRGTVEQAVQITPATAVTYDWVSDREVKIAPVAGSFAPNTQYTVALQPNVARSQSGSVVTAAPAAVFTVAPTPAPTPSAKPTPSPSASPLAIQPLGAGQPVRPGWLTPASLVYEGKDGLVEQAVAGTPTAAGPAGGQTIAVRPDGQAVLTVGGGVATEIGLAARRATPIAASGPVLAAAYDASGRPWIATAAAATAGPAAAPGLPAPSPAASPNPTARALQAATAAWFSPHATQLVYRAADGLRTVDLGSGKETAWPAGVSASAAVLGWAPDETRLLYTDGQALYAADPTGANAVSIVRGPVVAADWSSTGTVVYSTPSATTVVASDGSGSRPVADAGFQALSWAPGGTAFAYYSNGQLAVATLTSAPPVTAGAVGPDEAARTVAAFMQARVAGQADAAKAQLDAAGAAAYAAGAQLLYTGDPHLERWFAVATVPGDRGTRVDARLVLADAKGHDVAQLDEVLTLSRDTGGRAVIHGATATPTRPYGKGPEVIGVQVTGSAVRVQLDSDLAPATVADSVRLVDEAGKRVATAALNGTREVVLTPQPALPAGTYRLRVLSGLKDRDGRPAVATFELDLAIAASSPAPASPSPSPSPS